MSETKESAGRYSSKEAVILAIHVCGTTEFSAFVLPAFTLSSLLPSATAGTVASVSVLFEATILLSSEAL
jgi:hypothetical protein